MESLRKSKTRETVVDDEDLNAPYQLTVKANHPQDCTDSSLGQIRCSLQVASSCNHAWHEERLDCRHGCDQKYEYTECKAALERH